MMQGRPLLCGLLAFAMLLSTASARADDRDALQARCWAPADLAAKPGEARPVRIAARQAIRIPKMQLAPFTSAPVGAIRRVELPPGRKLIALTFDLCEQGGEIAGYDGAIFDYLRRARVKATLFAGGKWLLSHPERARQLMTDPLFEIANHGWAHRNLRLLGGVALEQEIAGPQAAYEAQRAELAKAQCLAPEATAKLAAVAPRMALFRFPYGACSPAALAAVARHGLLAIQWDVSTGDPAPSQSARAIAETMVRRARPGSIIIAHANGRGVNTASALPIAIPKLRAMGFEFVTVGELLAAGRPVVEQRCYDSHPGDTDRYDFLFQRPQSGGAWQTQTAPHGASVQR